MGGGVFQSPGGDITVDYFDRGKSKVVAITKPLKRSASGGVLAIELVDTLAVFPNERETVATLCFHRNRVVPLGYLLGGRVSRVVDTDGQSLREIKYPKTGEYRCEHHHETISPH